MNSVQRVADMQELTDLLSFITGHGVRRTDTHSIETLKEWLNKEALAMMATTHNGRLISVSFCWYYRQFS